MYKNGFKKLLKSNQNIKVKSIRDSYTKLDISFIFYYHFVKKIAIKMYIWLSKINNNERNSLFLIIK